MRVRLRRFRLLPAAAAIATLSYLHPACVFAQSTGLVELSKVGDTPLPEGIQPRQVHLIAQDTALLLGRDGELLIVTPEQTIELQIRDALTAQVLETGRIHVLTSSGFEVAFPTVLALPDTIAQHKLPLNYVDGARTDRGWFVLIQHNQLEYRIMPLDPGDSTSMSLTPNGPLGNLAFSKELDGFVSSTHAAPFSLYIIPRSGSEIHKIPTMTVPATGEWVALRPVAWGDTFIQTFSDLTTDRRVIAIYNANRTVYRELPLNVPLSLVAGDQLQHIVIGLQSGSPVELIWYRVIGN